MGSRLIIGDERRKVRAEIAVYYVNDEMSIREIAALYERSYGWTHKILTESGVRLRPGHVIAGRTRKHLAKQRNEAPS